MEQENTMTITKLRKLQRHARRTHKALMAQAKVAWQRDPEYVQAKKILDIALTKAREAAQKRALIPVEVAARVLCKVNDQLRDAYGMKPRRKK